MNKCSTKKAVFKDLPIFTGNACVGVPFIMKIKTFSSITLLKRDSNTGVFL